jgi:hypothetical protein
MMKTPTKAWLPVTLAAIFCAAVTYYLLRDNSLHFNEEVQLSSGEIIEVSRTFTTQSRGEVGGPGGWEAKFNSIAIVRPSAADNLPTWQSEAGLIPIVLDRDSQNGEWYLVTTFFTCEAWYGLGRPKLPYAEFRLRSGQWQQVELSPQLIGREANVMTGVRSGSEPKLLTISAKSSRNTDPAISPEYLRIVDRWTTGC